MRVPQEEFRAALYIRLSREDGDREESDSVQNQRALLLSHARADESIADWEVFVDDGYSGTDFERPGFQRMKAALEAGRLNCVMVKDLSRFGRDYIEVGRYLEQVFPARRIRFISVNDQLDSYRAPAQSDTILVPFKNLLNDAYSRDISQKIRSSLDLKRKNGEFIGAFASYGYQKGPGRRLEIDEAAAAVVRRIFGDFLNGASKAGIARALNAQGVESPAAYKLRGEPGYRPAHQGLRLWSYSCVHRILQNRIYAGDMVQGRNAVISYKLQRTRARPESEWFVVEDTHPAIVSREEWQRAQALLARRARADAAPAADAREEAAAPAKSPPAVHALAGFVRCADCGRALHRRRVRQSYGEYEYYSCPSYRASKTACSRHSVRVDAVERAVLEAIREQIRRAVDFARLRGSLEGLREPARESAAAQYRAAQRELEKILNLKRAAYEDWKLGELSREEYHSFKADYDAREAQLRRVPKPESLGEPPWLAALKGLEDPQSLDRALVAALVEAVRVHADGSLTIEFTFADALERAAGEG